METTALMGLVVVLSCALAAGSIVFFTVRLGIGPTPSSARAVSAVIEEIPESTDGPIFELGSGFGRLALAIARERPGARVVAFERSPIPFWTARLLKRLSKADNLELVYRDFFEASLEPAKHVVCYLYPGAMRRLDTKLLRELQPQATVISHTFALFGWEPDSVKVLDDVYRTKVYVYRRPSDQRG